MEFNYEGTSSVTLPTGTSAELPAVQANMVWKVWSELAPIAAGRGEGVKMMKGEDGIILISTVYAPMWEQVLVAIFPSGEVSNHGEPSSPYSAR